MASLGEKVIALPNATVPGTTIPVVGLGTWQSKPHEVENAVAYAIKEAGYRHIDGAFAYQNEKGEHDSGFFPTQSADALIFSAEVGAGVKASGVPRSEIFITSKVWCTYHRKVEECLDKTLADLGTDYVDLYLIHWPFPMNPNGDHPLFPKKADGTRDHDEEWQLADTWKQMEEVQRKGEFPAFSPRCHRPG